MKNKYEEIALELMVSIIQTNKPETILDRAISRASKSGEKGLVKRLNNIRFFIEGGYNLVDAFYFAELLGEETYRYLQAVSSRGNLDYAFIKDYLSELRERKGVFKEVMSLLALPLLYVIMASVMGTMLNKQFMDVLMTSMKEEDLPSWAVLHLAFAKHPFIGAFLIAVISLVISLGVLMILFRKAGYKEMKIYNLASIVSSLRRQNIPYSEIFGMLAGGEKDRGFRNLYSYIAEEVERERISQALLPFYELIPLTVALVFQNQLEKGAEVEGWNYLKNEMKTTFKSKMEMLKSLSPLIGYLLVAFIIIFSIMPLMIAIQGLMKTLTF